MNPQLLELFNGKESLYPHHLTTRHPRIIEMIISLCGSPEFDAYLRNLLLDDRGDRQGFSPEVIHEISSLLQANANPGFVDDIDIWGHVKEAREHLVHSGTPFTLAAFFAAAERGDTLRLLMFLKGGMNINAVDEHGKTPLIWASSFGHRACVGLLLANEARSNQQDHGGYTALHWAAANGEAAVIRLLLEHGAEINAQNHSGKTPLMQAAARCQRDALLSLLDAGADLNRQDQDGDTALHKALQQGHFYICEALFNHHADVHLCNQAKLSAFMLGSQHSNLDIRKMFQRARLHTTEA